MPALSIKYKKKLFSGFSHGSFHNMAYQYRSRNTSYSTWHWSNRIYDRLYCWEINISAEFTFRIYVNADINNSLTCTRIIRTHNSCTSGCHNQNIRFFCNCRHIHRFRMTDSHRCIFLNQHHCRRFSNYKTSSNYYCFLSGAVNSIVIQNFHTSLRCARRKTYFLSSEHARHRAICHTVNIFCRIQGILDHRLI